MALTNTIYNSTVFQQACNQFDIAADILGINRNTLRKKITELGIELKKE